MLLLARRLRQELCSRPQLPSSALALRGFVTDTHAPVLAYTEQAYEPVNRERGATAPRTLAILHGLLGSGRNWTSFGRRVGPSLAAATGEAWRIILIDLRNHGGSGRISFAGPHTLSSAAADVRRTLVSIGAAPDVLVGHSLGGKISLQFVKDHARPEGLQPLSLWVLDSFPGAVAPGTDPHSVQKVLDTVLSLPDELPSKKWFDLQLQAKGITSQSLRLWLATNVVPVDPSSGDGPLRWLCHAAGAAEMYRSYKESEDRVSFFLLRTQRRACLAGVSALVGPRPRLQIDEHDLRRLQELSSMPARDRWSQVHVVEKAGHWLHVDNPVALSNIMVLALQRRFGSGGGGVAGGCL